MICWISTKMKYIEVPSWNQYVRHLHWGFFIVNEQMWAGWTLQDRELLKMKDFIGPKAGLSVQKWKGDDHQPCMSWNEGCVHRKWRIGPSKRVSWHTERVVIDPPGLPCEFWVAYFFGQTYVRVDGLESQQFSFFWLWVMETCQIIHSSVTSKKWTVTEKSDWPSQLGEQ